MLLHKTFACSLVHRLAGGALSVLSRLAIPHNFIELRAVAQRSARCRADTSDKTMPFYLSHLPLRSRIPSMRNVCLHTGIRFNYARTERRTICAYNLVLRASFLARLPSRTFRDARTSARQSVCSVCVALDINFDNDNDDESNFRIANLGAHVRVFVARRQGVGAKTFRRAEGAFSFQCIVFALLRRTSHCCCRLCFDVSPPMTQLH